MLLRYQESEIYLKQNVIYWQHRNINTHSGTKKFIKNILLSIANLGTAFSLSTHDF